MKYCVKIDSVVVIDGGENSEEIMLKNATNCGFSKNEVEIITEEEYQKRLEENEIEVVQEPTAQDILNAKLIADNAELLKSNEKQKRLNADLLLKIAILGGSVNV